MSDSQEPLLSRESVPQPKGTLSSYANVGVFSALTFSWITPLLSSGQKKALVLDDIPQLDSTNSVGTVFPILQKRVEFDHVNTSTASQFRFAKALYLSAWKGILWTAFLGVLSAFLEYVCPFFIDRFVLCLDGGSEFKTQGYILAFVFSVANFLQEFINKHMTFKLQQIGIRLRGATSAMIFAKSLRLSSNQGQGSGELINLVAIDVKNIDMFTQSMHRPWLIILQVTLGLLILYKNLGPASFVALAATLGVMWLNSAISKFQETYQKNLMESRDNRMMTTTETLRNMQTLKLQGWELKFLSKILQLRNVEAQWLKKYLFNSAFMSFVSGVSTTFVALITFASCFVMGIPLHTGSILSSLAIFRVLEQLLYWIPGTISMLIQAKVSIGRIALFLSRDENPLDSVPKFPPGNSNMRIEIVDGSFSWDLQLPTPTLRNINLKVHHGMTVAICGKVGSGKSSLLSCLLGEMPKIFGRVTLSGTKAYVSQTPWIQSGTIQENILLGKEMDTHKYNMILEACCLKKDLEILSFGDQTIIGETGINLSGGQKQRIQIARALYHDADIYLFDDPFIAVDAHTALHLHKEVLMSLLCGKTVVYVTHQVEFLNGADLVLVMEGGMIVQAGKYKDLLSPGSHLTELVGEEYVFQSRPDTASNMESMEITSMSNVDEQEGGKVGDDRDSVEKTSTPAAQIIQEEEREKGRVRYLVYWRYITTAYGGIPALLTLLAMILCECLRVGSNIWIARSAPMTNDVKTFVSESKLMIVYASLAIGVSFTTLSVDMLVAFIGYTSGTILFRKMHECIFRAPMSFFDATPSGRILNRCSTDQSSLEDQIPAVIQLIALAIIVLVEILAVMAAVAWQILILFVPVVFVCIWYQRYYIPSARELSRLRGVCQGPIVQYFAEAISGAITIRCFGLQSRFLETYMKILDTYSRPVFCAAAASKWLMLRLDAFSALIYASFLVLLVCFSEIVDPAIAGVAVTYGLILNQAFAALVLSLSSCETNMISVERIFQYMSIPSEAPLIIEGARDDRSWPSVGKICINNLHVRYAPHLPFVLHGITCILPGRSKTGIVGRTGSGKSTLIQTLFRIVEPTSGEILIDGVDITKIGLHDLRLNLGIIPQDPIMFQGTLRSNFDPLELYTDEQIWETVDKCQLGDVVRKLERKLDFEVTENGQNWSMGQRQLICLGRVLLKKSKILVLDEATASVDTNTDQLIQLTLKEHFSRCTIITVAHRMTSVLNSDHILLLNNGVIEEFDSPQMLLKNESSSFRKLVTAWSSSQTQNSEMRYLE